MDPLSTLSVASSAIQIFEFSSKLWKQIRELHQSANGTTLAQETMLADAERLRSLNSGLCGLLTPANLQRSRTETEESVVVLCNECGDAAGELISMIKKLTLEESSDEQVYIPTGDTSAAKKRKATRPIMGRSLKRLVPIEKRMDAIYAAVKGVWMKKDVDKLCERVETLKCSLASTILVNIQHGLVDLNRKMDFVTTESVKWAGAKSFDDILRTHHLDTPHNEAKLVDFIRSHSAGVTQGYISVSAGTPMPEGRDSESPQLEPWSAKSNYIIQSLLKSLSFPEMRQRQESIHENFKGTFQWIYHQPRDADRPWDSFATWLTEGRGIYWITGKAGSGKSTLMRMLHHHKRTNELIRLRFRDSPLVTAAFFFWNSGSQMQMSQDGLLRSVLLQFIEQRLQQNNCDTLKEKLVVFAMMQDDLQKFEFKDLIQLFRFVIEDASTSVNFFLLLDGLDEFDGDKSKLISLIRTLEKYDHVKVCVSSRPWTVFEDGFRQQPSLMLQNLTHHDILLYTQEKLTEVPAFRELSWGDPSSAADLIQNVTRKASGVFLWVVLTVNSLIEGLTDGDRVKDLEARLEEIPEELEDLFSKMLHGLEGRYFQDAARLFQIHRATRWRGFVQQAATRTPLLVYGFADEHGSDLDLDCKWPPRALTSQERFMVSVKMKRRINSRCNGLLEIVDPDDNTKETWSTQYKEVGSLIYQAEAGNPSVLQKINLCGGYLAETNVQYLHRTVKDYLEAPEIWRKIQSSGPSKEDEYWILSLCFGHILFWRDSVEALRRVPGMNTAQPHSTESPPHRPSSVPAANNSQDVALFIPGHYPTGIKHSYKRVLENFLGQAFALLPNLQAHTRLLDALGIVLFERGATDLEFNQPEALRTAIVSEYLSVGFGFTFEDFLSLAVHFNLFEYVDAKVSCLQRKLRVETASRLLVVAVLKRKHLLKNPESLERGGCKYAAEGILQTDYNWNVLDRERLNPSFHIVLVLMQHGADPDFEVEALGTSARRIVDLRHWELATSDNYKKIVECFGPTK